jgi:hypothetical protein
MRLKSFMKSPVNNSPSEALDAAERILSHYRSLAKARSAYTHALDDTARCGILGAVIGEEHAFSQQVEADAPVLARFVIASEADRYTRWQSSPDDLREKGWSVAVHNDYRLNDESWTFWLFTKGYQCAKGEGRTDAEALNEVRRVIYAL